MIIHHLFLGDFHRPPVLSYSALSTYLRTYTEQHRLGAMHACHHAAMFKSPSPIPNLHALDGKNWVPREALLRSLPHALFCCPLPRPSNFARRLFSGCGCQRIGLSLLIISDNFGIKIDLLHSQKQSVSRRSAP